MATSHAIKLYPPSIEGTLPSFYGTTLVVPFSMNRAVDPEDVIGIRVKIKTIQSNKFILEKFTDEFSFSPVGEVIFKLDEDAGEDKLFNIGQFYKLQLAFVSKYYDSTAEQEVELIGHYSTVGVIKYTTEPVVKIDGLENKKINMHNYQYYGIYSQENGDHSEKVYSYCFYLYDDKDNIVDTSGEKIHNGNDSLLDYESVDAYEIPYDLELRKSYYLEYVVTTNNKMQVSSGRYRVMQKKFIDPEIQADLTISANEENGYISLSLIGRKDEDGVEYPATGMFKILRASEEDEFLTWNEVLRFALYGQQVSKWAWKDMTAKQGIRYKYALQQYNAAGITSNRIESNEIYSDFEHAFLFDGTRQLKIKYNPKVTSFKNTILENKLNTIGSQFPFTFRNGHVKYKEFPISGLISCQSDEEFLFADEENFKDFDNTINLVSGNILTEREFKLEVMDWLNNGKPKLFRSPSEGNYIIRLINVSLTPTDAVGRMLHTFQATAYEIAEYNYKNLIKYGLLTIADPSKPQLRWESVELDKDGIGSLDNILRYKAATLRFEGMIAGDRLYIDDGIERVTMVKNEHGKLVEEITVGYSVTIGSTGSYIVDLKDGAEIRAVRFLNSDEDNIDREMGIVQHRGLLTYGYYSKTQNRFDTISNIELHDIPTQQFIGECDVFKKVENLRYMIHTIYSIRAYLREILDVYTEGDGKYYIDSAKTIPVIWEDYILYRYKGKDGQYYLYDRYNSKIYADENYDPKIYFGDSEVSAIDLTEIKEFYIKDPGEIKTLRVGNGVMVDFSYQLLQFEYKVETSDNYPTLKQLRRNLDTAYEKLLFAMCPYSEETKYFYPVWIGGNIPAGKTEEIVYAENLERMYKQYNDILQRFLVQLEYALSVEEAIQGDVVV